MDNFYIPKPIDIEHIELPAELVDLSEFLACNVHDTWAQGRMHEGWTYAPVLDREKKHHPCLVPYDELPESEKEYDRNTTNATLKAIMACGFVIEKHSNQIITPCV
jgi:ryanodine receptor 2